MSDNNNLFSFLTPPSSAGTANAGKWEANDNQPLAPQRMGCVRAEALMLLGGSGLASVEVGVKMGLPPVQIWKQQG